VIVDAAVAPESASAGSCFIGTPVGRAGDGARGAFFRAFVVGFSALPANTTVPPGRKRQTARAAADRILV
jgi:hypothetical protein